LALYEEMDVDSPISGIPTSPVRTTSPHAWKWFLALEAVFALIYFPFGTTPHSPRIFNVLPWMEWPGQVPAWAMLGISAVVAMVYGVRRNRPNSPIAWWFLSAGVLLFITGDTTYKFWHQIIGQQNIPFPSFIDAIYITMYPVLAIGLLLLARKRSSRGDQTTLIDALTVTLGVGLLSWIFLIGPNVRGPGTTLVRLTAAAYPLGDVLLLAMLAHLWSNGGFRHAAGRLLAIGTVGTLIADSLYGFANLHANANWSDGNVIDLGWILFYSCWGAAALHPSMRALSEPKPAATPRTRQSRLMLLATVSLIAPVVLLVEAELGHPVDAPVIAVVAGLMFLLVLLRMAGLVRAHEHAVTREQVLRTSSAELVAAASRDGIYAAAIAGMNALVSTHGDLVGVTLAIADHTGQPVIVGRSGHGGTEEAQTMASMWAELRAGLTAKRYESCVVITRSNSTGAAGDDTAEEQLMCALVLHDELQGLITITSTTNVPFEFKSSIEILAAQVELALDREAMTEIIHTRRSEAHFQTLVQNASDVILIVRPDTTITYQTPSAFKILGYAPGTLEGRQFTSLLHPDDVEQALAGYTAVAVGPGTSVTAHWRVKHFDGSWRHIEVIATNLLADLTVEGMVLTMRDVTERMGLEEELKHQAFHDALSGLANRALFRDRLEHALSRASRSKTSLAVLFIDLDDFKLVNDSLGHAAGDELLVTVAGRISGALRAGDTAARFGGDEFAVLLEETASPDEASEVADRIIADLSRPIMIEDHEFVARASIGIVLSPEGAEDPSDLMQAADVAMYAAKAGGKNRSEVYQPALQSAIVDRLERTADLIRAMEHEEFVLHYQPIIGLEENDLVGHEALVRWQHPQRGLLLPSEFISLAEETGLIVGLGRWVLREACRQAQVWKTQYASCEKMRISVNISARQFQHVDLVQDVSMALEDAGLDPRCLVLEITESMLVANVEAIIARMMELKELGVSFAIDDFGTGYSSLSYLKNFPIDILKLDKSFVDELGKTGENGLLAETIVRLGSNLQLQTIAEGIEETRQFDVLRSFGCQFGQGYYLARPLTSTQVEDVLLKNLEDSTASRFASLEDILLAEEGAR
jgi:diguanylate cyclase (GGDEF)-like protein/PAS domain S-box-containing protein